MLVCLRGMEIAIYENNPYLIAETTMKIIQDFRSRVVQLLCKRHYFDMQLGST
jgi:hypothetical protein